MLDFLFHECFFHDHSVTASNISAPRSRALSHALNRISIIRSFITLHTSAPFPAKCHKQDIHNPGHPWTRCLASTGCVLGASVALPLPPQENLRPGTRKCIGLEDKGALLSRDGENHKGPRHQSDELITHENGKKQEKHHKGRKLGVCSKGSEGKKKQTVINQSSVSTHP